jgi:hypothetical protein
MNLSETPASRREIARVPWHGRLKTMRPPVQEAPDQAAV